MWCYDRKHMYHDKKLNTLHMLSAFTIVTDRVLV